MEKQKTKEEHNMNKINYKSICNFVCCALLLVLLVLQFLPGFWTCQKSTADVNGEYPTESASLQEYIWTPAEFLYFENYFEKQFGKDFELNQVILMPVVTLVCGALGIICGLLAHSKAWPGIFAVLAGGVGAYGYLTQPMFQMGPNWQLHMGVCIALAVISLVMLVIDGIQKFIAFRKEYATT